MNFATPAENGGRIFRTRYNRFNMNSDLKQFWQAACDETMFAYDLVTKNDSQFNRRTYVRTVFSVIEAIVFWMKSVAIDNHNTLNVFSEDILSLLREEYIDLDDKGNPVTRTKYIQIEKNIRFSTWAFFKSLKMEFKLDCSGREWLMFKSAISARNRIIHPRSSNDLFISNNDLNATRIAIHWILKTLIVTLANKQIELLKIASDLQKTIDRLGKAGKVRD